jgi:chromate reductase, NAD(P)H dehydrogenase (quinone)
VTASRLHVAALVGSLRKASYNRMALNAAIELAPAGMSIEPVGIGDLPHYDDDVRLAGYPPEVERLRTALTRADAILFVTPEYNYSIPGVLKNAIDWASRPPSQPFDGKPVAIMGASGGLLGTARAQYQLRQMLVFLNAFPVNKPEVMIGQAASKFDEDGRLADETTRDLIRQLLGSLAAWTRRLQVELPSMAAE